MEFAAILIDADGVYDPADVNDRMLHGLGGPRHDAGRTLPADCMTCETR
jgi:hypothetical protein